MRVRRDFEQIYETEVDPWSIGDAGSDRYDLYRGLILERSRQRGSILDVGCGFGAFLARFHREFERLVGVEVSEEAIRKGRERFPFVEFEQGSADQLEAALPDERRYDAIVFSDVVYYLDEEGKNRSLRWIGEHLSDDGLAFVSAWCPGGKYLEPDELQRLVERRLAVEERRVLDSGHAVFVARRKRFLVALTVDHETWQPIPEGRRIDWEADVFSPTAELLDVCDAEGARVTLMAELGEYFWLREHEPALATRMEEQWADAVRRGHDVQLHLHPNWLPELGAKQENGRWSWDWSRARADDYPGDLAELIRRCKATLEDVLRPVDPTYEVTSFRAGAYEAQPFRRLYDALAENGVFCDSSVYAGGRHPDRSYDYSLAYSTGQPYFAGRFDPQLKAPPAERAVVELPVLTVAPGERWTFDGAEGDRFAERLVGLLRRRFEGDGTSERYRRRKALRRLAGRAYGVVGRRRRLLNRMLPRQLAHFITSYEPERLAGHEYLVLVGHSKSDLEPERIRSGLRALRKHGRLELVTLSALARSAREELVARLSRDPAEEAERQVRREYDAVLSPERNDAQSHHLQELIPLDRRRVLDLGCGAGAWTARIAQLYPWATVLGIDIGEDFVAKAAADFASERVSFQVEDFASMSFPDAAFDCVYADNTLEHAFDVQATLAEVHRVLEPGGVLVAAIPSDARNPRRVTDNHTWKTAPHDVRARLEDAGFVDVAIEEVDTFRRLGMPPYPPSDDRMMYVRGWKRELPLERLERAAELTRYVYAALDPERGSESEDGREVLAGGVAWCWGYAVALGEALRREGYEVRWISMLAEDHPRGRGERSVDSHEVVEVAVAGARRVLDPMSGVCFDASLEELLSDPERADLDGPRDERWRERGYDLYATSFWYTRVRRVAVRTDPRQRARFVPVERLRDY